MQKIHLDVQEPYFSYIQTGQKTIEGRLNEGKFKDLKNGDILIIGEKEFNIEKITQYPSFKEMLSKEGVENVIPDKITIDEAEAVYYKFYTPEQEKEFGVVGITITQKFLS